MSNFPLISKIFHSAANKNDFKALYIPFGATKGYINIHSEIIPNHLTGKNFLKTWAKNWVLMSDALPDIYAIDKDKIKMLRKRDIWGFFNILTMRSKNILRLKDLYEYKTYIKQVTPIPYCIIVILCCLPCFCSHIIREIIRPLNKYLKEKKITKIRNKNR